MVKEAQQTMLGKASVSMRNICKSIYYDNTNSPRNARCVHDIKRKDVNTSQPRQGCNTLWVYVSIQKKR